MPLGNGGIPSPGHAVPTGRTTDYPVAAGRTLACSPWTDPVGVRPSSSVQAQLYSADVLENRQPIYSNVSYTAISELNPVDLPMTPGRRAAYSRLPTDISERAKKLAQSWHPPGRSDDDVIRAGQQFFRDGGFFYTLTPGLLPKEGALDYFLFKSRHGFCEHYAAAFSTLMRAAGLPARIVVGYQGGEYNGWGGHYTVRQSDAHAWSEVWVTGKGWQREDPTAVVAPDRVSYGAENYEAVAADSSLSAEARLERLNALNTPGSWRWLVHYTLLAWDGLDQQWNVAVLGYDQDKQQTALHMAGVSNLSWLSSTGLVLATVADRHPDGRHRGDAGVQSRVTHAGRPCSACSTRGSAAGWRRRRT